MAQRSDLIAPETRLTKKEIKFYQAEFEQRNFADIRRIISRENLLAYQNFIKPFVVYTEAIKT